MSQNKVFARADKRALAIVNGIQRKVSVARRLDGRLNNLSLFQEFTRELKTADGVVSQTAKMSVPEWADHPDVQLLLMRRDRVLELRRDADTARQIAEHREAEPETRRDAIMAMSRLRALETEELDAISKKLDTLRAESTKHWSMVAKMLSDITKLRQTDDHFRERIKLQRDKDAMKGLTAEEMEVIALAEDTREELKDE